MTWRDDERFAGLTAFQKAVFILTVGIPRGRVSTYGVLARVIKGTASGPAPAQAVGNALHSNCFAPEVPCHRVLKSGTGSAPPTIGGFSGTAQPSASGGASALPADIAKKRALLAEEGVTFDDGSLRLVDAERVLMTSEGDWDALVVLEARGFAGMGKEAAASPSAAATPGSGSKRGRLAASAGAPAAAEDATEAAAAGGGSDGAGAAAAAGGAAETEAELRARLSTEGATGAAVRAACRDGRLTGHTSGLAPGLAQANLVILPAEHAADFERFCALNPAPCPLLEVTQAGSPYFRVVAPGADVRRDLPRYRIWRDGACTEEVTDVSHLWPWEGGAGEEGEVAKRSRAAAGAGASSADASSSDASSGGAPSWRAFLLGCSFSFEEALLKAGLPVRHLQQGKEEAGGGAGAESGAGGASAFTRMAANPRNVPMYRTSRPCVPSGPFSGPLVVSMRPMTPEQARAAVEITGKYPRVHGAPVHIGDPAALGIADISKPDYGDAVTILPGEVPVFWACGVTPQAALVAAKLPLAITHAPGHMLVLDISNESLAGEA